MSVYLDTTDVLSEIVALLAQSPDREVRNPVLPFYVPTPPTSSRGEESMMDVPLQGDTGDVEMEESVHLGSDSMSEFVLV